MIELVNEIAYNVKHGGNNKVFDYAAALTGGTDITGVDAQDTFLVNNIETTATLVIRNQVVSASTGNTLSQVVDKSI